MNHYDISLDIPLKKLSSKQIETILYGSEDMIEYKLVSSSGNKYEKHDFIEGIADKIERKHLNSSSEMIRK